MIPPPNDAELERLLVETQRRPAGRPDRHRPRRVARRSDLQQRLDAETRTSEAFGEELIEAQSEINELRQRLDVARHNVEQLGEALVVAQNTRNEWMDKYSKMHDEVARLRRVNIRHSSDIAGYHTAIDKLRQEIADMGRAFDAEVERRIEREQRIATIEAETAERIAAWFECHREPHHLTRERIAEDVREQRWRKA